VANTLDVGQYGRLPLRAVESGLRFLWSLLTSVRAAIFLVLALGTTMLVGVLVPQMPSAARASPELTAAWIRLQEEQFGILTDVFHRLGFFDVFHTWLFIGLLSWLVCAVSACTINRVPKLWRQTFQPPQRVSDGLFERSTAETVREAPDPAVVEMALRRKWFEVRREDRGNATYLFADRFAWTSLGTLLSHAALILFLVAVLVTKLDSFSTNLTIAEGGTSPVFPVSRDGQITVEVKEAVGMFDAQGRPLDYHSDLVLYRNGDEVKACTITVNDPCSLDGYRFHQAGFFGYGAQLRVRDIESGNVVYNEILALQRPLPSPDITILDRSGASLYEGTVPQTDLVEGTLGSLLTLPDHENSFWVGLRAGEDEAWTLVVFDPTQGAAGDRAFVPEGSDASVSGLTFHFKGVSSMPSLFLSDVPLPLASEVPNDEGQVLLSLENAIYGTQDVSAGDERLGGDTDGPSTLHLVGIAPATVRLAEGERVELGRYDYEFVGPRNFAGIGVRKDSGDDLVWLASGLFIGGLMLTLWIPRRRGWFRFRAGEMRIVSQGRARIEAADVIDEPI